MNLKLLLKNLYKNPRLILFTLISLYLFLELLNITVPGLYDDEALPACGAIQIINRSIPILMPAVKLFNIHFPLVIPPYHTALESYILLPFFWLFGIKVVVLRSVPIIMGAITLIFVYLFLKDFFDKKVGLLAVFLLVINNIFLLETKLGLNSASMLHFAAIGALLSLWRWYRGKGEKYFYLGIFLLGLGISIRVWFTWFVDGVFLLGLIFYKNIVNKIKKNILRYTLFGTVIFCLGIFLFIFYNITSNLATIKHIIEHFSDTRNGINNFEYLGNLISRLRNFSLWLNGSWSLLEQGGWYNRTPMKDIFTNPVSPGLFLWSFIYLTLAAFFKKSHYSCRRVLFILLLFIVILLQSPLTLSTLGGPHLFILYPLIQIIIALAFIDIIRKFKTNKIMFCFIAAVFFIFIFKECNNTFNNNYLYFNKTGGTGNNSNSIYAVSKYLEDQQISEPIIMDWGIYHNLIFLSQGKAAPKTFGYIQGGHHKEIFVAELKNLLKRPNTYIFHAVEFSNRQDVYAIFIEVCRELGKSIIKEKIFYQKDGKPVFVIYSVS